MSDRVGEDVFFKDIPGLVATFATPGNLERLRHGCGEDSSHWISSRFRIMLRLLGWGMNRSLASLFTTCSGFLKGANYDTVVENNLPTHATEYQQTIIMIHLYPMFCQH